MHFIKSVISVALFAAAAIAQSQLAFTSTPSSVQVGQQYTITWTGGNGPVTITLRSGDPNALDTTSTITTTATGGSYTWTPSTSIPDGSSYALQISQGSDVNYSGQFAITGGTAASASVSQASILSSQVSSASAVASSQLASASSAASAASSSISSVLASQTSSSSSSASTSASSSSSSKATSSSTQSSSSTSSAKPSSSSSAPSSAGNAIAANYQSPLALIFGAVAAMAYFQ